MRAFATLMLAGAFLVPLPVCGQDAPPPEVSLHVAALQGNLEAVRRYIEAGADLNEKDAYGSTPLMIAATGWWPLSRQNP